MSLTGLIGVFGALNVTDKRRPPGASLYHCLGWTKLHKMTVRETNVWYKQLGVSFIDSLWGCVANAWKKNLGVRSIHLILLLLLIIVAVAVIRSHYRVR